MNQQVIFEKVENRRLIWPKYNFASSSDDDQLSCRRILEKFSWPQRRPSLITFIRLANSIPSKPVKRWNCRKADWKQYSLITDQLSSDLPFPVTTMLDEAYQDFSRVLFSAANKIFPRGCTCNGAITLHAGTRSAKASAKIHFHSW